MRFLSWLGLAPLLSELRHLTLLQVGILRACFAGWHSPRWGLWLLLQSSLTMLWLWFFMPPLGVLHDPAAVKFWLTRSDMWGYLATMMVVGIGRGK